MLARETHFDPAFAPFVRACQARGIDVAVVSSGVQPLIERAFARNGLSHVRVLANEVDASADGWRFRFRDDSDNGHDKAAAVRAAYRPAPDWNKPLVSTPMGALPTGVLGVVARGPDLVVLCLVPTWIAILLRSATPALLVVQLALSAVAVLVASSTSTESWFDRLSRAMDEQSKANGTAGSRR